MSKTFVDFATGTVRPVEEREPVEQLDHSARKNVDRPGLRVGRYLSLQERFEEWMESEQGQVVHDEFVKRSFQLRALDWSHYGAKGICESIRFDRAIRIGPSDSGFKVNNSFVSRLVRKVIAEHPELEDLFELRVLKA